MSVFRLPSINCLSTTISFLTAILIVQFSVAQEKEPYNFFPEGISYDANFPTPTSILGYEVGDWHVSHDQLVYYMKEMARLSDRITIEETGRTYENRPLLLLTITSPENHARIDEIKSVHVALSNPQSSASIDITNMPAVVWLGHSVHGNEASGSNSSILTVYHWAAAQGEDIDKILANTIILIDPSINPDGLQRFSTWVNTNKGKNASPDPNDREHNEVWPRGRTNHYWFDLNRDWLPMQHPESKARMAKFHEWKPNIVTDHHEMGSNSTFFFQPGIPSRNNPLIPQATVLLTEKIARFHARELDKIGSFYYSQESFDDFYFGKGSTYPDINGSIGILFEQASSRGHVQNTVNGELTFKFGIRNHFTTAYSTVLSAQDLRLELLEHQRTFYKEALNAASSDPVKAYIWNAGKDKSKAQHFIDLLIRNQVAVYTVKSDQRINGKTFAAGNSFIVPLNQTNYRLAKTIFESRTTFTDSLFYDVSAWTLPLAMNLNYGEIRGKSLPGNLLGSKVDAPVWPEGAISQSDYAYAIRWDDYYAPKILNGVLSKDLIAKVATKSFASGSNSYTRGTILIPVSGQNMESEDLYQYLSSLVSESGVDIYPLNSGHTSGVNLGSGSFRPLRDPKVAIITDGGVSGNDVGEVWHLLDYRMDMGVTLLPIDLFNRRDISRYKTIIMVNGNYGNLNVKKMKSWLQNGGVVVANRQGGKWLADKEITKIEYLSATKSDSLIKRAYDDNSNFSGAQVIGGAIFNTRGDLTHPILYGVENPEMPVFRRGQLFMKPAKGQYATPLVYASVPLLAGYISKENHQKLGGTAAINVSSVGSGRVITFVDNPNFRAFWYGTNKLFLNAIFFGHTISGSSTR